MAHRLTKKKMNILYSPFFHYLHVLDDHSMDMETQTQRIEENCINTEYSFIVAPTEKIGLGHLYFCNVFKNKEKKIRKQ